MTETFSLEESAGIICGRTEQGEVVPGGVQWLRKRLASGQLSGFKSRQRWRMTQQDIDAAIESLRPRQVPTVPSMSGLTRTSARRLAAS